VNINGKACLLDPPGHEVAPMTAGNGDGQFRADPVLSDGTVGGKKRVLGLMPFEMTLCTGKGGSQGKGSGSIRPSQSVSLERGLALLVDGDWGLCNGKQTLPNGPTVPCVCRVTVRTRKASGPDKASNEGEHNCTAATPPVPLVLRLPLAPQEAAHSAKTFTLRTDKGEQSLPASAAAAWGTGAALEFNLAGEPQHLRVSGPQGREQLLSFHNAPPSGGEEPYPSGRPLFAPQDIHQTGFGSYNVNRFRIYFRVPPTWRLADTWRRCRRERRTVRVLDLERGLPSVEQLADDFRERFDHYFNGGTVGKPTFTKDSPLPQHVEWEGGTEQLARVLRLNIGGQTFLGFEGRLNGLAPAIHVDWVSVAWPLARGFAVQTLRRKHPDWASRLIDSTFIGGPPSLRIAMKVMARLNEYHFLSGRRSWILGKGSEALPGLPDEVYYLDTSSIDRYTGAVHGLGTHHLGRVLLPEWRSVRDSIVTIWSTLLRNYVRLNGFLPYPMPAGGDWLTAPGEPSVLCTEGRLYREELDEAPWVHELMRLHPTLGNQLQGASGVSGPPLQPGVYLAARDLNDFTAPHGRAAWVPTHQFLVLVPNRPGDYSEATLSCAGTRAIVLGVGARDGHLAAGASRQGDEEAFREFCAPPARRGNLFDTEVRKVNVGDRSPDQAIREILAAVSTYERMSRRHPIRYPTPLEQLFETPGCINSNSWVQSLLESLFGYAPDREDMGGADNCRENRIPRWYFREGD